MHIYLLYKRQRQVEEDKWDMFLDLVYTQKLCLSLLLVPDWDSLLELLLLLLWSSSVHMRV